MMHATAHARAAMPELLSRIARTRPLILGGIAAAVAFETHMIVDGGWLFPALFAVVCIGAALHATWPVRSSHGR